MIFNLNFVLFVTIFCSACFAEREKFEHASPLDITDILLKLEKRINDPKFNSYLFDNPSSSFSRASGSSETQAGIRNGENKHQSPQDVETCDQKVVSGSIIKASESIDAGADYVDSINRTKSNAQCQRYCCDRSDCDVAVYQDKDERVCYLFNCKGNCKFKDHPGYMVNTIKLRTAASAEGDDFNSNKVAEDDLEKLNGGGGAVNSVEDRGGIAGVKQNGGDSALEPANGGHGASSEGGSSEGDAGKANLDSQENQHPVISQHSVSLLGYCTDDSQCEDTNAACHRNNCKCKAGFYSKEGICRKLCPDSHFECFKLGTITPGPECVPRSKVCDSYMECADGSDEFNCDSVPSDVASNSQKHHTSTADKTTDNSNENAVEDKTSNRKSTHAKAHENVKPVLPTLKPKSTEKSGGKTGHPAEVKPSPAVKPVENKDSEKSKGQEAIPPSNNPSHQDSNTKHVYVSSSREKVIIASPGGGNAEGPIVALSLGLALTLLLLIMVACRLRGVRHRLRKGRPLNQNEADYLINGMYL